MHDTLTVTGEREHREFSPSRSERFILCPGSINLLKRVPLRERTSYAKEGETAHTILEAGLKVFARDARTSIDNSIYFAEDFDVAFKAAINDALDYIWGKVEELNAQYGDAVLYTETFVNPPVAAAPGEAAGYCDIAIFSAKARRLWVIDYKHGEGIVKDVVDNSQVMQYAAGFLYGDQDNRILDPSQVDGVVLVIIQPRAFHPFGPIRETMVTPAQLCDYLMELDGYIMASLEPDAPLNPGLDQCRFCEARSACPALESRALSIVNPEVTSIKQVTLTTLPDPRTIDVHRLAQIKQSFELLNVWMKGVDSHISELVRSGQVVPGFKLVEDYEKRQLIIDAENFKKLAALIGCEVTDLYNTKVKTITELEKLITESFKSRVGRGRKKQAAEDAKQMFAWFVTKVQSGNLILVKESDSRPPINKALQSFEQLRGIEFNQP